MEALYRETNALILQTKEKFMQLETNGAEYHKIENSIQETIDLINKNCEQLYIYVMKVPAAQRPYERMRCDQLKYDCKHLQAALTMSAKKRELKEQAKRERELLLTTRFRPNAESTTIDLDYSVQQHEAMQNAHRGVDEMLYTGANTLDSLRSQRSTLQNAKQRIIEMGSMLGLSTHVMKMIDRRVGQDKIIMIAGMLITLLIILIVIIYLT